MKKLFLLLITFIIFEGFFCPSVWADGKKSKHSKWYEFWEFWEDHEEHDHQSRGRRFYKAHRISAIESKEIVYDSLSFWHVGKGRVKRDKKRIELIIPLLYRGQIIGDIKVNTVTGEIMSKDEDEHSHKESKISLAKARYTVRQSLSEMNIGNKISLGRHGNYWEVPLMFKEKKVEEIKVGTGSGNTLPDWHKEEETYNYRHGRSFNYK